MTLQRDKSFSVVKAIAIIFVVLAHAGSPSCVAHFVYQMNVPIFFICAGYFFRESHLENPLPFIGRRFKGLYWPFLKWSLFFLIFHNLFFFLGLLSETYGNASGGVLHPYDWHTFFQRSWSIAFNMSGYDEFLAGSFWFFRSLLLASIGYLVGLKIVKKLRPEETFEKLVCIVVAAALLLIVWKIGAGLKMTGVAQGGYRELLGVVFMGCGTLISCYRNRLAFGWKMLIVCLVITIAGSVLSPSSMGFNATYPQFFSLLPEALAGFGLVYCLALLITRSDNVLARGLTYIGDRTIYVFAFHLLAFKLVSAVKVGVYGLPWQMVGGHTVVNAHQDDLAWIAYTIVGVGVPLAWVYGYKILDARFNLSLKNILRMALALTIQGIVLLCKGIKITALWLWDNLLGLKDTLADVIKASSVRGDDFEDSDDAEPRDSAQASAASPDRQNRLDDEEDDEDDSRVEPL